MPRKILITTDELPYHVYNRSNNKEFFYLDLEELWPIFLESLCYLKKELKFKIHGFVLMSNHYHLILSTPDKNLSAGMTYLHREAARRANKKANRINHFFGSRYKWSLITEENHYWNVVKYVFRNPVKAKFCENVEDYTYSSLLDKSKIWEMINFFDNTQEVIDLNLDWLNQDYLSQEDLGIKNALNKRIFKLGRDHGGFLIKLNGLKLPENYSKEPT